MTDEIDDSNSKRKPIGDRFVFHEQVLDDEANLSKKAIVLAGRIQHLREAREADFALVVGVIMRWLGTCRSAAYGYLNELIKRGHLERLTGGRYRFRVHGVSGLESPTQAWTLIRPEARPESKNNQEVVFADSRRQSRSRKADWYPTKREINLADLRAEQVPEATEEFRDWAIGRGVPLDKWGKAFVGYFEKDAALREQMMRAFG